MCKKLDSLWPSFIASGTSLTRSWPNSFKPDELMTYYYHRSELSLQDGIILWGQRVIIPEPGRAAMSQELHDTHPGVSRMKALARSYVFWPGIDNDIEAKVKNCEICQRNRKNPPPTPLHPWDWPDEPWESRSCRFCRRIYGFHVLDSHWCTFKMDGCLCNAKDNNRSYQSKDAYDFCKSRVPRGTCNGQWTNIYKQRIPRIHSGCGNTSYLLTAIPSIF